MIALTQTARSELAGRIWKNSWFANETKLNAGVWQRIIFIAEVPIQDWVLAHLGCLVNKSCNLVSRVLLSWSQVQSQCCAGQLYHPDTSHPCLTWLSLRMWVDTVCPENIINTSQCLELCYFHGRFISALHGTNCGVSSINGCHILENVITL